MWRQLLLAGGNLLLYTLAKNAERSQAPLSTALGAPKLQWRQIGWGILWWTRQLLHYG